MVAAVLMLVAMSHLQDDDKPPSPRAPSQDAASNRNDDSEEDNEVSIPVCGGMHLDA